MGIEGIDKLWCAELLRQSKGDLPSKGIRSLGVNPHGQNGPMGH